VWSCCGHKILKDLKEFQAFMEVSLKEIPRISFINSLGVYAMDIVAYSILESPYLQTSVKELK